MEPGLLQTLPSETSLATPLKVEIQENYLDSGKIPVTRIHRIQESFSWTKITSFYFFYSHHFTVADIEGALIIADSEEMSLTNMTLDYYINDNGTCTCKLCGEVLSSRTHWYRHKYKVLAPPNSAISSL